MVKATAMALPLVQETDGIYSVCEEGRKFLECLSEDVTLAVVVVAGRYRSGKSFLLNRGLLDAAAKKGFATGNSTNACTRGVWIYPMPLNTHSTRCYIVLDTEGTASLEAKAEQDARLIGIALSLASVFIFNATGSLDETSLSDLATLTTVAQGISSVTDKWQPPELIWVLRDFALQLQGDAGEDITPAEYLERALSAERYGKSGVRTTLKHFFQKRTLFPMVRPCVDEAQLQKLNNLSSSNFRPEFQKQLDGFRELVKLATVRPKEIGGLALNGPALAKLALAAVASVNEGKAPSIQTTFDFLQERRSKEFEEEALAELDKQAFLAKEQLPLRETVDLTLPMQPSFMQHLPDLWKGCEERLRVRRASLVQDLERANAEAQSKLMSQAMTKAESGGCGFAKSLEELGERLGHVALLGAVPRLHAIYVSATEAKRLAAEERCVETTKCIACLETQLCAAKKDYHVLREQMDEALVQASAVTSGGTSHEEYAQMLAETRLEAQNEMNALSVTRDALSQELRTLLLHAESARMAEDAQYARCTEEVGSLRAALGEAEMQRDHLVAQASEKAGGVERLQRSDLEEIKADFQVIVRECEGRASAACKERDLAQQRSERAEQTLQEGRQTVSEEMARLAEEKEVAKRDQEEFRRRQTQDLLEKRQMMTDAYSGVVQEAQRSREAALSADRKLMMTEVEKESLKRRVDSLETDSLELSKTRRLYDDVRFKHISAEATVEASSKMQEMQKSQLLRLETELRDVRTAARQRDLELTRKAATLELQLQARGIALS